MDNGIYVILSRQTALFRDMAVTANNLANVNTTGYRSQHMVFQSLLTDAGNNQKVAYTQDAAAWRNTAQGATRSTRNPLDVALDGPGYFAVQTPLGQRYTRAGNFQLDGGGILVSAEGYPVLDDAGQQITFEPTDVDVKIGAAGNISVKGVDKGSIGVFVFGNEQALEKVGDRLFKSDATPLPGDEKTRVLQGTLEDSNVNSVTELVHLMEVSRAMGNTAKYIERMYELQRKTNTALTQQQG